MNKLLVLLLSGAMVKLFGLVSMFPTVICPALDQNAVSK